jgi:pseudouridine synthase
MASKQMRLQKFLAQAGVASRRKSETLITAGRVRVNGRRVTRLGSKIDPAKDRVQVDGANVRPEKKVYWLVNKPVGYVSTVSDPQGRDTVLELIPQRSRRLFPVGRLDIQSEGALLLTNDGALTNALLHPSRAVKKTYRVRLRGQLNEKDLAAFQNGIPLDDGMTAPTKALITARTSASTWLEITLREGRNRQIRRMAEALGFQVARLIRVTFAGLSIHNMKAGEARPLKPQELQNLRQPKTKG